VSIRNYNKDHLKEHAGVTLVERIVSAPESNDPLVFWTMHETEPCEVDLHPFATGQDTHPSGGGPKFLPFAGRAELIRQLRPAVEEILLYAAKKTVDAYKNSLRSWWRVIDSVEAAAVTAGQPMTRVEDVRHLTHIYSDFAHRRGMDRHRFCNFRYLVDATLRALDMRPTYWETPEDKENQKHIPPQQQRNALRIAVKRTCRSVLERWAHSDRLGQSHTEPEDQQELSLWQHVKYIRNIQKKTGKVLPSTNELCDGVIQTTLSSRGISVGSLRESVFPTHRDADAVWHQCLLNTGWNSSTLNTLDVTKKILFDHFKDDPNDSHRRFVLSPQTYELVGKKERAGGKEQVVTGQWKTLDGPGHLIKTYLKRVEPLREVLKQQLAQEQLKYLQMEDAAYKARTAQFAQVKALEQGCRSVWLYVNRHGKINWISNVLRLSGSINGKQVIFLDEVVHLLNTQQAAINAERVKKKEAPLPLIPHVAPKDFRVWFADYVYRSSNGNMLHLKRALNHARLGTVSSYTNTTILNQEASDAARQFLNVLVGELDVGRVDLTILAHLYRYGIVTLEQEEILAQLRDLPKSRMKVACKDAAHPPAHLKATVNEPCDVQRCMLCVEHAVLLPESLDGIAMRAEELRALQGFLPIETWLEERYDVELKNNLMALRKFDLNQVLASRKKWAKAIACGDHYVPGLPLASSPDQMELV
jgi:hypothetical protein